MIDEPRFSRNGLFISSVFAGMVVFGLLYWWVTKK
jgi:hypothetical protein